MMRAVLTSGAFVFVLTAMTSCFPGMMPPAPPTPPGFSNRSYNSGRAYHKNNYDRGRHRQHQGGGYGYRRY